VNVEQASPMRRFDVAIAGEWRYIAHKVTPIFQHVGNATVPSYAQNITQSHFGEPIPFRMWMGWCGERSRFYRQVDFANKKTISFESASQIGDRKIFHTHGHYDVETVWRPEFISIAHRLVAIIRKNF
jgi:hypothetical protein